MTYAQVIRVTLINFETSMGISVGSHSGTNPMLALGQVMVRVQR
jgi:hypothetical protein